MTITTADVQPTHAHAVTSYPCVGVSSRPLATHAHACTCGWRSVEHVGTAAACTWVETCPQSLMRDATYPQAARGAPMTITATLTTYRLGENTLTVADETGVLDRLVVHVDPSPFGLSENHPRVTFLLQRYGYVRAGDWHEGVTDFQRTVVVQPHPDRCETCAYGCGCQIGEPGCTHAFCWGVVTDDLHTTCPGAALVTGATHPIAA